jgi:hypothetical protein
MNYRLLLSEMLIDYSERMSKTKSFKKRQVYREVLRDLRLSLEIETNQISIMQEVNKLID